MTFLTAALVTTNVLSGWEVYLLYRQQRAHRTTCIPPAFSQAITQDDFNKTQTYSRDKIVFSMIHKVKETLETSVSLLLLPNVWYGVESFVRAHWIPSLTRGGFRHAMAVSIFGDVVSTLLEAPFSYYQTFVLEAKHGFNKTTRKEFFKDKIKSLLLRIGLLHPITIGLINLVVKTFGSRFPLYLFGGASAVIVASTFLFPVLIQPLFNKFTPLPEGSSLKVKVEALAKDLSFPLTQVYEVDGSRRSAHSNAYFYGFFNSKRVVLFDTLLKQLTEPQIMAVLCHEFGHWKHGHTKKMFAVGLSQLAAFCYGAQHALFNPKLFADFGLQRGDMSPVLGFQLFSAVFFEPLSTFLQYLVSLVSRRFEFEADAFAVRLTYGRDLMDALRIMQVENKASITPDWLFAALHYSHPPLVERLAKIEELLKKSE